MEIFEKDLKMVSGPSMNIAMSSVTMDMMVNTNVQKRIFCELKIVIIFLLFNLNMCFTFSKETSHREGSFEYPQHMFWLRNKKNNFPLGTLIWWPVNV